LLALLLEIKKQQSEQQNYGTIKGILVSPCYGQGKRIIKIIPLHNQMILPVWSKGGVIRQSVRSL